MNSQPNKGAPVLLAIGDSVVWGQGLNDENKFYRIVWDQLRQRTEYSGLVPSLQAHSGAIIGAGEASTGRAAPGEIPWKYPSIIQQCQNYDGDPNAVQVVLVDGGINDVTVQAIVDPETAIADMDRLVDCYCYRGMADLLRLVTQRFANPDCKVFLTGYYQILGSASSTVPTIAYLELLGITTASKIITSATGMDDLVALSRRFHMQAEAALAKAAADVNAENGDMKIRFVNSGLSDRNALFQQESMLWGLKGMPPFLDAADDFEKFRSQVCSYFYLDGSVDCATCRFASVGHPTAGGAIQYARQILDAFEAS
jgi:hypothetical protein